MKIKIAKYCLGVAGISAFTAITVANMGAYLVLKRAGLR